MSKSDVINEIVKVCNEIGANAPLLLAFASVESGFNPNAKSKSGTYIGLYQLSDGYGGCKGTQRNDIRQATICCWKQIQSNMEIFRRDVAYNVFTWQDWYAYAMHQQGISGFKYLIRNKDKRISDIDEARRKAIATNTPKGKTFVYVKDFLNHYENKIVTLMKSYENAPRNYSIVTEVKENMNSVLIVGLLGLVGLVSYLILRS